MADASTQLVIPNGVDVSELTEGIPARGALSREQGGTGASVSTVAELLTHLGRAAANGFAPLDSGVLVPVAYLPTMGGASSGSAGTAGAVPQPSAGEQMSALRGDGTFNDELQVDKLYAPTNLTSRALRLASTGDGTNYLTVSARGAGSYQARIVANGDTDEDVNVRLDPLGAGMVTEKGKPVSKRLPGLRRMIVEPASTNWARSGLPAPTEYGTAASATSARGSSVEYTYAGTLGAVAGLSIASVVQRRWDPSVLIVVEHQLYLESRAWIGLFSGDPSASDDPNTLSGVGIRFNGAASGGESTNYFRSWSCDGAGTSTVKALDGTGGTSAWQPSVSLQWRLLFRHVPASVGKWQIWLQRSDDDGTSQDGSWYLLATHDANASEKVPGASAALGVWVTHTKLDSSGTQRKVRVKLVDIEQA